jgi:hypothetical protein
VGCCFVDGSKEEAGVIPGPAAGTSACAPRSRDATVVLPDATVALLPFVHPAIRRPAVNATGAHARRVLIKGCPSRLVTARRG